MYLSHFSSLLRIRVGRAFLIGLLWHDQCFDIQTYSDFEGVMAHWLATLAAMMDDFAESFGTSFLPENVV